MQKRIILPMLLWAIFGIAHTSIAQSGWTKEKGKGFAQISLTAFSSDRYFNTNGDRVTSSEGTDYQLLSLNLYAEHGVTDRLNLLLSAPIIKANRLSTTATVLGVGDIRIGAKFKLSKTLPLALSVEAEIPTSNGENFAEANTQSIPGIIEGINLPTSDGEFNFWTTLALSKSFGAGKTYGSLFASINSRTQGLSWQWQSGGEIGYNPINSLWIIGKARIQKSFSNEVKLVPFLYGEGTEYNSLSMTAIYSLNERLRATASYQNYASIFVNPQNIYNGGSISIGLAIEY